MYQKEEFRQWLQQRGSAPQTINHNLADLNRVTQLLQVDLDHYSPGRIDELLALLAAEAEKRFGKDSTARTHAYRTALRNYEAYARERVGLPPLPPVKRGRKPSNKPKPTPQPKGRRRLYASFSGQAYEKDFRAWLADRHYSLGTIAAYMCYLRMVEAQLATTLEPIEAAKTATILHQIRTMELPPVQSQAQKRRNLMGAVGRYHEWRTGSLAAGSEPRDRRHQ